MASLQNPSLFPTIPCHRDTEPSAADSQGPPHGSGIAQPASRLLGMARLVASSESAGAKRGTEYYFLPARSIVNSCQSERVPFRWTINPYRGCEFGCRYCYARYTHEYLELDGHDFERKIYAKANAGALVTQDLERLRIRGEHIAIGTATDPYQPAESEFGVTREILERLAERSGMEFSITTKSNRVLRDVHLLQRIAEKSSVSVNVSIVTPRLRLARALEPRAPTPQLRFDAVRKLRQAGIAAGVFVMPVIAGLTDRDQDLDALARSARDAGANWFVGGALHLMPSAAKEFFPWAAKVLPPPMVARLRAMYEHAPYGPESYRREISRRFEALRQKYGLCSHPAPKHRPCAESVELAQLALPLERTVPGVASRTTPSEPAMECRTPR
jgi:DNA repair photolyase